MWRFGVMMILWLAGVALGLATPGAARAEGLATLPPGLIDRIDAGAPRLLEEAGALILSYGRDGQIDAAGIDTAIDHSRARRRASALARILENDLDGDGQVTTQELGVALRALSPVAQARAKLAHDRADDDGNGIVTSPEARASAQVQALRGYSDKTAQKLRDLLAMDMDGDGWLGLDEVAAVVARQLQAATVAAEGARLTLPPPGGERQL